MVSRILSARSVYVIGLRSAAPLAQFLVNYLRYMFDHVRLVSGGAADGPEDMLEIGASDVLIGLDKLLDFRLPHHVEVIWWLYPIGQILMLAAK